MDYAKQIDDLIAGNIEQIDVTKSEFFEFNKAWKNCSKRKQIIGVAHRNGNISYRFSESDNN